MGAVTGFMGLGGGAGGTSFAGPSSVNMQTIASQGDINAASRQYNSGVLGQEQLIAALKAQNGIQNQSNVYNQLQGVASGAGPNPAQSQYYKNVQDLAQQQSGAISSAKGISPALATRMISQQGSAAMQNAAGQGGANLANQQLAAMSAAGNIAGNQVSNQMNQTNTNAQTWFNEQQGLMNQANQQNSQLVNMQSNVNNANAGMAGAQMKGTADMVGGIINAGGKGTAAATGAEGGMVHAPGPRSMLGQHLASGGKVNAVVSPGELWLPPSKVNEVAKGKNPLEVGERIPGTPKVAGNSYANDTVPKKLDVGGVVIPNSVMQSKDPAKGAQDFIAKIIAKKKARG